ncbi:MAG: glycosyltransferase [Acidobacteria bacterium]|nr:glycosyltransferase [Acidobacteriota bacterium]
MPRLAVILPVYNHESYVAAALDSIFAQDYTDFEVVAVDDGSTDESLNVLDRFGERIRILQTPHRGPAAARNRGIAQSDSEFVAFMDSDDVCQTWRFSIQSHKLEFERLDFVASELSFIDRGGNPLPGAWRCPPHASRDYWGSLLERNWVGTPSVMLRRESFRMAGMFDEEFRHAEDYDLWLRIGQTARIGYVDAPLVQCRRHAANTSSNIQAHEAFERRALQKVTPVDAWMAFDRLYPRSENREEAWIWFLLRSGHPAFDTEVHRALQDYPESRPLNFALGVFLYEKRRFDEACVVFAPLRTGDPASMNNFAVASAARGDIPAGFANLEDAICLRPDYYDARYNISALHNRRPLRITRRPFREDLVPMV